MPKIALKLNHISRTLIAARLFFCAERPHFDFAVICRLHIMACKAFFAPHRDSLVLWEHLQYHASHHNRPYNIEPPSFIRLEYVCEHSRRENNAAEYQLAHVFLEHINFYYLFHLVISSIIGRILCLSIRLQPFSI